MTDKKTTHEIIASFFFLVVIFFAAVSANAASFAFDCSIPTNAQPRCEVVVTNLPVPWPKGADRLYFEIWCADESEEAISRRVNGGKGENGKLKGWWERDWWDSGIEELPSGGSMLWGIQADSLRKGLDINALSNVTFKVLSGAPVRFGVSRVFTLEKGEQVPKVEKPVPRHPRDAAEHAVDFAAFKEECAHGDFVIGWATSMENVRPRGGFKWRKADKVGVRLARGEYESVQILVAPNGHDLKGVQVAVEMGAGFAATNVAASVVGYTETIHPPPYVVRPPKGGKMKRPPCGWYPDPILDFQKSCDISGNDVQSFWIRVKCPRDQEAGVYEGSLFVSAQGVESVRIPFSVRVNDFEVGRVSPLPMAITFMPSGKGTNDFRNAWRNQGLKEAYCDFLADYFITWDSLYVNPGREPQWDMLLRLKRQGRLGLFNLCYYWWMSPGDKGEEQFREKYLPTFRARYEKAKELGLEKHAYFYGCDEQPQNVFTNIALALKLMHKEFPGVPLITTARDRQLGTGSSPLKDVIHCPAVCFWDNVPVRKAQAEGRQVWWYFCNDPASPFANTTLEGPPCEIRSLMGAQTQRFRPDGFLYWETASWKSQTSPIQSGPFTTWQPRSFAGWHGDGQWFCCGGPDNMLLATIRLENFRDGVEDLWYAKLLEQKLRAVESGKLNVKSGGDTDPKSSLASWMQRARKALAVPTEVARSVANFSTDPVVLYRWRDEMADLIEEASRK